MKRMESDMANEAQVLDPPLIEGNKEIHQVTDECEDEHNRHA